MENKMLKITIFNRDKDHEKDHYYDIVSTFFIMMIQKYLKSKLSFSMIITLYHKDIENDISKELKQILIEDVRILINSSFHEGYCPDRSPFEKIPNEIRDRIYSEYFEEKYLGSFDQKFFWRILLEEQVIPFLKFNEKDKIEYKKIMNEVLIMVPEDLRKAIIDEYYTKNWVSLLEINENEITPSKQVRDAISKKPGNGVLLKKKFSNLTPVKKKVVIDIIWDLLFDRNKRFGMSFTNELLSLDDKEKLSDIAVNQYINSYKTVKADYLDYYKGKGI